VTAADENKDGRISVDEMSVMLRNIYSHQPISREEVQYIMEIDLGMNPDIEDSVPMEKVKQLLLEIYH
jgi:Ca2+-binding EF-hand superfamily protein